MSNTENRLTRLVAALRLAVQALDRPDLVRVARRRGLRALAEATGHGGVRPDPTVLEVLRAFGLTEPTLTELALTTTPELAEAWVRYARNQGLGAGFVVTQLRAGQPPPDSQEGRWYSEEERRLFFVS